MNLWFVVKARALWLFAIVLAAAGLATVLYAAALPLVPALDAQSWLPEISFGKWRLKVVHVSAAIAALGVLAGAAGVLLAHRQAERLRAERSRAADRLRRVKVYRSDELADGRLEPFFGAEAEGGGAQKDRRAA
jgi:hypothetical protein